MCSNYRGQMHRSPSLSIKARDTRNTRGTFLARSYTFMHIAATTMTVMYKCIYMRDAYIDSERTNLIYNNNPDFITISGVLLFNGTFENARLIKARNNARLESAEKSADLKKLFTTDR
jgi:hypothetical protein